jgi:hypothetical protein
MKKTSGNLSFLGTTGVEGKSKWQQYLLMMKCMTRMSMTKNTKRKAA